MPPGPGDDGHAVRGGNPLAARSRLGQATSYRQEQLASPVGNPIGTETRRPNLDDVCCGAKDEAHGVRAIRGGAAGYVKKSANLDELLAAIERVHRGERVIPEEVEAALGKKRSDHPAQVLSSREFQVMEYLAAGKTNREIAEMLAISVKTVDTHRGHVLKKLRLRNNSDITRFAISNGLIPV